MPNGHNNSVAENLPGKSVFFAFLRLPKITAPSRP